MKFPYTVVVGLLTLTASHAIAQTSPALPVVVEDSNTQANTQTPVMSPEVVALPIELSGHVQPDVPASFRSTQTNLPQPPCTACQFSPKSRRCSRCGRQRRRGRWENEIKPRLQASHWGYCDQFCERPFGTLVNMHFGLMVNNGIQQQMALYAYDFQSPTGANAAQLSGRGKYQLTKLAILMNQGYGPLMIEATHPELDAARREHVMAALAELGVEVTPEQVLLRRRPRQWTGEEVLPVHERAIGMMRNGGGGGASASASSGISVGSSQ